MKIINIALPVAMREQGNQFARCIGMGPDDDRTFSHGPNAQDAEGNLYIVTSGWVVPHLTEIAIGELVEPEWGCDMVAAQLGQSKVVQDVAATPEIIAAMVTADIALALSTFGLTRIVQEDEP